MKAELFLTSSALSVLLAFSIISTSSATVITFDDLHETGTGSFIANGYQGLVWSNFVGVNALLYAGQFPFYTNGYYYGVVSGSNVAYNANGGIGEIDSATNFNFLSAYLTGAWNSNLNVEVQGFSGATLLYDTTVVAGATSPTLFTFNYQNIDRLTFNSFGGEPAFFPVSGGNQFAADNLTFEFVPEPSSLLLATVGALLLCPLLKRKRAT